jgi:hypothetical protein
MVDNYEVLISILQVMIELTANEISRVQSAWVFLNDIIICRGCDAPMCISAFLSLVTLLEEDIAILVKEQNDALSSLVTVWRETVIQAPLERMAQCSQHIHTGLKAFVRIIHETARIRSSISSL